VLLVLDVITSQCVSSSQSAVDCRQCQRQQSASAVSVSRKQNGLSDHTLTTISYRLSAISHKLSPIIMGDQLSAINDQ
jgi:hypothetical protein